MCVACVACVVFVNIVWWSHYSSLLGAAEVNAGPLEICRLFLGEEKRKEWPEHHVLELDAAMKEFFKLCGFALVRAIQPVRRSTAQHSATH